MINERYSNLLFGIGNNYDEPGDYVQNYLPSDYPFMMFSSYPINNMNNHLMSSGFYLQPNDPVYGGMPGNGYGMQMNPLYNNYGAANPYLETNKKTKKYDMFMSKNL